MILGFLLHCYRKLSFGPANGLGVPALVQICRWVIGLLWSPLCGRSLSSGVISIHNLLSNISPVLLALLDEVRLPRWQFLLFFSLDRSNVALGGGSDVVLLRNLLSLLFENPVVLVVVVVAALVHEVLEYFAHVVVVGSLFELEVAAVLEIDVELLGHAPGQRLDRRRDLLVLYSVVLVIFGFALQTLPWQTALQEVYQDESDRLEVVSSALFDTQMGIDTGIPGRAGERLVVLVGNVFTRFGVSVPLGQPIIDNVYDVLFLAVADQEVVWLHVAVDEVVIMQELQPLDHLVCDHQRRLDCEFPLAVVEKIF